MPALRPASQAEPNAQMIQVIRGQFYRSDDPNNSVTAWRTKVSQPGQVPTLLVTSEYKFLKFQTTTTNNVYEQLNYAWRSQTTLIIREKNSFKKNKSIFLSSYSEKDANGKRNMLQLQLYKRRTRGTSLKYCLQTDNPRKVSTDPSRQISSIFRRYSNKISSRFSRCFSLLFTTH